MKGIALTNLLKTEAIHFHRPLQLLQILTLQTLCAEGCQKYKCRICPLLNRGCPRGKGDMLALVMQSYNSFCQWTNAWLYYLWLHYFTSFILRNTNKGIHNRNELMVSSGIWYSESIPKYLCYFRYSRLWSNSSCLSFWFKNSSASCY